MKLMIASDLHGSAKYTELLVKEAHREKPDKLLLLGDYLYHGPRNPLPGEYETQKTAEILNGLCDIILAVRGNCDAEVDQMLLKFPIFEEFRTFDLGKYGGTKLYACHGHHFGPHSVPAALTPGDILICGHTHIPAWQSLPYGIRYFNPGSISIPKGGSCHSYMIVTDDESLWIDLEQGSIYHSEKTEIY